MWSAPSPANLFRRYLRAPCPLLRSLRRTLRSSYSSRRYPPSCSDCSDGRCARCHPLIISHQPRRAFLRSLSARGLPARCTGAARQGWCRLPIMASTRCGACRCPLSAQGERSLAHCGLVTPPSAWRRIARIWGSLYFVIFIQNRLMHIAKKILLMKPLTFGGITPSNTRFDNNSHSLSRLSTFHVDVAAAILAPSAPVKTD